MSGAFLTRKRGQASPKFDIEAVATFLRRRHPANTADMVADATGISAKTVRNWLAGTNEMRALHLIMLVGEYGPDVLAAAWPEAWGQLPGWLDAAQIEAEHAALDAEMQRIENRRLELAARQQAR